MYRRLCFLGLSCLCIVRHCVGQRILCIPLFTGIFVHNKIQSSIIYPRTQLPTNRYLLNYVNLSTLLVLYLYLKHYSTCVSHQLSQRASATNCFFCSCKNMCPFLHIMFTNDNQCKMCFFII